MQKKKIVLENKTAYNLIKINIDKDINFHITNLHNNQINFYLIKIRGL